MHIDYILVIGGNVDQLPFIKLAKKKGFKTIVVDRNNLCKGFKIADIKIRTSTYDFKMIISRIKKLNIRNQIKYIINRSSGIPVLTTAKLFTFLNLPHTPYKSSAIITFKDKLYKFCNKNLIKIPNTKIYKKNNINIPKNKIIKPAISLIGKQSVYLTTNENQAILLEAINNSLNGNAIVQDYIRGKNIVMYSHVINNKLINFEFLDEINFKNKKNKFYGKGFAIPSVNIDSHTKFKAYKIAHKLIKILKINNSPLLISFNIYKKKLYLIEIHLDLGGDKVIEFLLSNSSNINFINLIFDMYVNKSYNTNKLLFKPTLMTFRKNKNSPSLTYFKSKFEMRKHINKKLN